MPGIRHAEYSLYIHSHDSLRRVTAFILKEQEIVFPYILKEPGYLERCITPVFPAKIYSLFQENTTSLTPWLMVLSIWFVLCITLMKKCKKTVSYSAIF